MGDRLPWVEPVDRITGDPESTGWRRAARHHQHLWREAQGLPMGSRTVDHNGVPVEVPMGSRLPRDIRYARSNFLTDAAADAVDWRLTHPQRHQTLDEVNRAGSGGGSIA
jgi:hypothetical protein